jgi:hypothetical protein
MRFLNIALKIYGKRAIQLINSSIPSIESAEYKVPVYNRLSVFLDAGKELASSPTITP